MIELIGQPLFLPHMGANIVDEYFKGSGRTQHRNELTVIEPYASGLEVYEPAVMWTVKLHPGQAFVPESE
jgi:hypothetical protein